MLLIPVSPIMAGLWIRLIDDAEAQLNALLTQLEVANGAEVAVVTVPGVAPSPSPKAFTTQLFNRWGTGKAGLDNGVLVMVSRGDRWNRQVSSISSSGRRATALNSLWKLEPKLRFRRS